MTDSIRIHTDIPLAFYVILHRAADKHDTTVNALVAEIVRRSLQKHAPKTRKVRAPAPRKEMPALVPGCVRKTPGGHSRLLPAGEALIRERHALKHSDKELASALGVGQPTASKWRNALGLPTNYTAPVKTKALAE